MALVIEDGTSKVDANSYIDLATARSYAADRGVTLSADDTVLTPLLIKATDYLESKSAFYVGKPSTFTQRLSWPRQNVRFDPNTDFPSSGAASIPQALKDAQCQLVIEENNGVILLPTTDPNTNGGFIVREKIDVIETQYSERIGTTHEPLMPAVDALLQSLLYNGGGFALRSIRV